MSFIGITLTSVELFNISKFEKQRKALAKAIPVCATNPYATLTWYD